MTRQNRRGIALSGALLGLAVLSFSDTARAQSVTAAPQTLTFTVPANTVSQAQQVQVTGTGVGTVLSQINTSWIRVAPAALNLPGALNVSVDTTGLTQGTTSGSFVVYSSSNSTIQTTVTVNLTVTGASQLSASPTSLTFTGSISSNAGTPQGCPIQNSQFSCQVTISSSGPQLTYNITPSTNDGHPWLILDRLSGQTSGAALNVGVNPSAVPNAGTFTGSILFQSTTTGDSVTVNVTMTVTSAPAISVAPTQLNFFYTLGGTLPAVQQTTVSSTSGSVTFNVTQSGNSSWLGVSPISGAVGTNSPVTLNVSASPNAPVSLPIGRYTATITITPTGGGTAQAVNVVLIVSASPFLTVSTNQLTFSAPFGGSTPATQAVIVGSTGGSVNFSAAATSDQNFLTVTPTSGVSGNTQTGTLTIGVSQAVLVGLAVGTYNGTITVTPANGDPYNLQIAVTLTVGASSQITAAPQGMFFSFQMGQGAPAAQTLSLNTSGPPLGFSIATAVNAGNPPSCTSSNWLSATPQTTPTTTPNVLTVMVNTAGMTAGNCTGTVKITYASSSGNAELDVPVTLFVSNSTSPLLNISLPTGFGIETATLNGASFTRNISMTSTDNSTVIQYQVGFQSASCPWLFATPLTGGNSGATPTPVQVSIQPGCITSPGTYQGSVTLTSANLPQPVTLLITLTVTSNVQVSVTPQALNFQQAQNGPLPAPQNLTFTVSGGNANFIATASTDLGSWLQVTPGSGNTSLGSVSVSILSNTLPQNATPYNGRITLTFQNAATPSAVIPVRYTVTQPQTVTVSPTALTFAYQLTGTAPASQALNVSSTGGQVNFTVGTTSTGGWLGVDATSGQTGLNGLPKAINVSIDPTKIPSGTLSGAALQGSITISAAGVLATPITVNVTLNISAAAVPQPSTIVNSAVANGFGAIAAGELIAIKGTNLGPASPASGTQFTVNAQGTVNSTLAGVQVTFDNIPGTPTFVSATQINVIVPWEIAGRTTTNMVVSFNNTQSAPFQLQVTSVSPGIYTQNATGIGQAAAVNLSPTAASPYNGPLGTNYPGTSIPLAPAAQGSFLSLFLTGGGQTSPGSVTGSINPGNQLLYLKNWTEGSSVVTATVGGLPAHVSFAGAAPTLINGVVQINLQIPTGVSGNNLPSWSRSME
jgi:uncharacterized protein (TIGR03437 family)